MPPFTLTYTREAAPCLTFLGRTAEGVSGAAVGISGGGRDGVILPPPFCKLIFTTMLPRGCVGCIQLRSAVLLRSRCCVCT